MTENLSLETRSSAERSWRKRSSNVIKTSRTGRALSEFTGLPTTTLNFFLTEKQRKQTDGNSPAPFTSFTMEALRRGRLYPLAETLRLGQF